MFSLACRWMFIACSLSASFVACNACSLNAPKFVLSSSRPLTTEKLLPKFLFAIDFKPCMFFFEIDHAHDLKRTAVVLDPHFLLEALAVTDDEQHGFTTCRLPCYKTFPASTRMDFSG